MRWIACLLALAAPAMAGRVKTKEIGPKARGKVYEWKAKDGLAYYYFVPKDYDADRGAGLTFILHGSNLSRMWGFANHPAGAFRPRDIVVSPDGTTPNGRGGFNFLGRPEDARRLRALHEELGQVFKINATYLYGHSQGSFFALYYAGEFPGAVQGVVAHASGSWNRTRSGPDGHAQAIVFMHGTQDPVVPYAQSVGGFEAFREAGYPRLRLRSLEGWNHWPAEVNGPVPHTSQQLAWVEGMTTPDPARLEACFDRLADVKVKDQHDYAAVYTLARRVAEAAEASEAVRKRARSAMAAIEKLAQAHADALKDVDGSTFRNQPWIGHLPRFLRGFMDVPARDRLAEALGETLDRHRTVAVENLRVYYRTRGNDPAGAFAAAVRAITEGFLHYECADRELLSRLLDLRKQARKLQIDRDAIRAYDAVVPGFTKAQKEGARAFDAINRKAPRF